MVTVVRQLEGDRGSTTTLVVSHGSSGRRARSSVAAGRTIGHAVNDVHIGILVGGDVEMSDREATLVRARAARERRLGGMAGAGRATAVGAAARGRRGASALGSSTGDAFLLQDHILAYRIINGRHRLLFHGWNQEKHTPRLEWLAPAKLLLQEKPEKSKPP